MRAGIGLSRHQSRAGAIAVRVTARGVVRPLSEIMDYIIPLVTLATVQLLAVMSPGQSFILISKLALSAGRTAALAATLGLGVGTLIWSAAAIAGLALVFKQAGWLYSLFKIAGGLYLLYLAALMWRNAEFVPITEPVGTKPLAAMPAFWLGLLTQIANPKVAVFFGSIFVALLPPAAPPWVYGLSMGIVVLNETLWYALVGTALSVTSSRAMYLRAKAWIDRTMAVLLGAIGVRLIADM